MREDVAAVAEHSSHRTAFQTYATADSESRGAEDMLVRTGIVEGAEIGAETTLTGHGGEEADEKPGTDAVFSGEAATVLNPYARCAHSHVFDDAHF